MKYNLLKLVSGLAVLALGLAPAAVQAQPRGSADVPVAEAVQNLVAATGVPCQIDSARLVGQNLEDQPFFEVSCSNGPGYILIASAPPQSINCLANAALVAARRAEDPNIDPGAECTLARNANAAASIQPIAQQAGVACQVDNARWMGVTSAGAIRYEIGCANADGAWADVASDGSVSSSRSCLEVLAAGGTCELTTREEQLTGLMALAGTTGRQCQANNARFVGANQQTGQRYFEVSCADSVGFMIRTAASGDFETIVECAAATGVAGGCTLSDQSAISASTNAEFEQRLSQAGISCALEQVGRQRSETTGSQRSVVEFQCSDRPWGLIAFLPNGEGSASELDCLSADVRLGGCLLTTRSVLMGHLSALMTASRQSCSVDEFRVRGRIDETAENIVGDIVELRCGQGSGYVVVVNDARNQLVEVQTCRESIVNGGLRCELS